MTMKNLLTAFLTFTIALGAIAEVPSLINYQGKLSDESGNPVNGTKAFSLKIYDAKTGGKEIYQEEIGNVALKNGIYSFGFGEAGKSVVTPVEILARADGNKQVYNYITKNKPVLGNITISGPELSWTDDDGSSDATKFTATANKDSGAISAIYLNKSPSAGSEISITYDHLSIGVMGALSRGGQSWLEITVDGKTLSPRERLVTVPFALRSRYADSAIEKQEHVIDTRGPFFWRTEEGAFSIVSAHKIYLPNPKNTLIFRIYCWGTSNDKDKKTPVINFTLKDYEENILRDVKHAMGSKVWTFDKAQEFEIQINDVPRGFYHHDGTIQIDGATLFIRGYTWTRK